MASRTSSPGRAVRPVQLVAMLVAFVLIAVAGGLLTAGLLLPAVGSVGAVSSASTDLFDELPTEIDFSEPSERSTMLDSEGNVLARFFSENRTVVAFDDISQHVKDAVVATEDRRFYEHAGIDPEGILRAVVQNAAGEDLQGASTLTQQYVKNVQIEQSRVLNDPEMYAEATETEGTAGVGRKFREARFAVALEQVKSKDDILAGYLNLAQFGPSQYGVEAAAQHYFNKSAADLNVGEAAMLAGITQSPARWDPVSNPENALVRRNRVLGLLLEQGYITREQHDEAQATSIEDMLDVQDAPRGCGVAGNAAYYCQYVVNEILNNDAYGETTEDRRQLLNRGGLTIHTTLEPDKQQDAFDAVTDTIPVNDGSGISMALSSIEPGTGHIFAMAQNTNYGTANEEDPNATQVNYNVGTEYGGGQGFQSGSTFKVFTLIEWLRTGHSLMDKVNSANRHFAREDWNISCAPDLADDYDPKNLEGFGGGMETVLESTRMSINTAYVVMAQQMDLCAITGVAESLGVQTGAGEPLTPNPAMILGTNTVTPLSMANAIATLAAEGEYCEPMAITSMVNRQGEEIPVPPSDCKQVLEPEIVHGVTYAMEQVTQTRGATGANANLPDRPTAGKTGTANDDKHAWFMGFIPQMATAVWMGHANQDIPMLNVTINGEWYDRMWGGRLAAPTWRNYMEAATEGMPVEEFPEASDEVIKGEDTTVPNVNGKDIEEARSTLEDDGFRVSVGSAVDSAWTQGTVAATSPGPGTKINRGDTITLYPSTGQRPAQPNQDSGTNDRSRSGPGTDSSDNGGDVQQRSNDDSNDDDDDDGHAGRGWGTDEDDD